MEQNEEYSDYFKDEKNLLLEIFWISKWKIIF